MVTYTANRRLKIGGKWRQVGEPVPEAHGWLRLEEWLHTGYLREVELSHDEFRANLKKFVPAEGHDALLEKAEVTVTRKAAPQRRKKNLAPTALKSKATTEQE